MPPGIEQANLATGEKLNMRWLQQYFRLQSVQYRSGENLGFFTDTDPDRPFELGKERVYQHFDEGAQLLRVVHTLCKERGYTFQSVVDLFSGGGHSMIPILKAGLAKYGVGIDLNPLAAQLANQNARLNGLEDRALFQHGSVETAHRAIMDLPEPTLFVANPPFALDAKKNWGIDDLITSPGEGMMRSGGVDGLDHTRSYINTASHMAVVNRFKEIAMNGNRTGDTVIGLAYSRIDSAKRPELDVVLNTLLRNRDAYALSLVKGAPLWRNRFGVKDQQNPMPIMEMWRKAKTLEELELYWQRSLDHIKAGYPNLGYFRYMFAVDALRREEFEGISQLLDQENPLQDFSSTSIVT